MHNKYVLNHLYVTSTMKCEARDGIWDFIHEGDNIHSTIPAKWPGANHEDTIGCLLSWLHCLMLDTEVGLNLG